LDAPALRGSVSVRSIPGLWCGFTALLLVLMLWSVSGAWGQEVRLDFDLPAQPLENALVDFASKSGMAALIDRDLAQGLFSSPVKGHLTPPDALNILLAGTGLSMRPVGAHAFTVGLVVSEVRPASVPRAMRPAFETYFLEVQQAVERALCSNGTRVGRYRLAFQIWVDGRGGIQASHFLSSTGDVARDAMVTMVLAKTNIAPPPSGLPQPLTIILKASDAPCIERSGESP
jgi:hypothetical protein